MRGSDTDIAPRVALRMPQVGKKGPDQDSV
jgi:hypothetical protein